MRDLAQAIANNVLDVHYQPKLVARTGQIDGAEALVRWTHPVHGPVSPDLFVRIAEETGYIRSLTEWVMLRVIADARMLRARGHILSMHINVSALLLPDPDFAAWALASVPAAELKIGFEITETAVIGDPRRALANLSMFADAGIRLAIDDYGSGFSSLAYLQQLPVHEIKLDKMFVSGLTSRHRDPLLVRSSIDLAHALEMDVTAEGIETPEALALLQVMGCDRIQGFLIARPMPIGKLIDFLDLGDQRVNLKPVIPLAEQLQRRIAARRG
jgi:EAL domain-containing protein (putative c-di-GMP-specific phosphodiesterase class I)